VFFNMLANVPTMSAVWILHTEAHDEASILAAVWYILFIVWYACMHAYVCARVRV
jgi:hypothetical protein